MIRHLARAAVRQKWLTSNARSFRDGGPARRPRLFVDVSVIMRHDAGTGIQRVVRSVWAHLAAMAPDTFDVVPVCASSTRGYCFAPSDFLNQPSEENCTAVGVRPGDKFLGLDLSAHYTPNYLRQLTAWRKHGASLHFIVYDLLPLTRPDWFSPSTGRNFSRWFSTISRAGDQALCISVAVADELRRKTIGTLAQHSLKIGRLHLSGDIAGSLPSVGISKPVASVLERSRSRQSILMIGTVEPRKAYDRALDAFEQLWAKRDDGPDLVIVGKPGWKTSELQSRLHEHPEQGRRLHWLQDVSDEALTQFYQTCSAVFLASYDEGFGLPLIEAASHRRWTLVRDIYVFREQSLSNLCYFTDDAPEQLASALEELLRAAEASPPPPQSLPAWSWCVDRLLEEINLAPDAMAPERPMLRIVS